MANILILEDDEALGKLLTRMLERDGHVVQLCTSGTTALAALTANDFSLLISDLIIQKDGRSVPDGGVLLIGRAQNWRRAEHAKLKILAISGAVRSEWTSDLLAIAKSVGADRVLPKPIGREEFLKTVNELLAELD